MTTTQNHKEWENPKNWSGPRWMSLYFSKVDTRLVVPKQYRGLGWTINFGHPQGSFALGLLIAGTSLIPLALVVALFATHIIPS